jgi:hypothetical protein
MQREELFDLNTFSSPPGVGTGLTGSGAGEKTRDSRRKRGVVDHEAIFDVALLHAVIGFVDLLDQDHLDLRDDAPFGAEIEHLLRLVGQRLAVFAKLLQPLLARGAVLTAVDQAGSRRPRCRRP